MELFPGRYLAAKKTVDDRALNHHVWQALRSGLPQASRDEPLQILEVGAGIGTMLERLIGWDLVRYATITALDVDAGHLAEANHRLAGWAVQHGWAVGQEGAGYLRLQGAGASIRVRFEAGDISHFAAQSSHHGGWDLLVAHAMLDLLDLDAALPPLVRLLRPGGLLYATLNFDGATIFQPVIDADLDALIECLYHETMDRRSGSERSRPHSHTGRHLFNCARAAGASVIAAGGSDWVVFAGPDGYAADEAYFLHCILAFFEQSLAEHPRLEGDRFRAWLTERRAQIDRGELVFIAHQLDALLRAGGP